MPITRKYFAASLLFCAVLSAGGFVWAAERAVIRFTDIGSVSEWHAENTTELFVQNLHTHWYRITFAPPCLNLPFALGISLEPDILGNIDKDGSILVDGERCFFKSIEESMGPISETETEQ